ALCTGRVVRELAVEVGFRRAAPAVRVAGGPPLWLAVWVVRLGVEPDRASDAPGFATGLTPLWTGAFAGARAARWVVGETTRRTGISSQVPDFTGFFAERWFAI